MHDEPDYRSSLAARGITKPKAKSRQTPRRNTIHSNMSASRRSILDRARVEWIYSLERNSQAYEMVHPGNYENLPAVHEESEMDHDTGQQQQRNSSESCIEVAAISAKLADTAITMMMSENDDRIMSDVDGHAQPEDMIDEEMEDLSSRFARA